MIFPLDINSTHSSLAVVAWACITLDADIVRYLFVVLLFPFSLFSPRFFFLLFYRKGQNPGEDANGDGDLHTSRADLEFSLGNVKGEIAFPDGEKSSASRTSEVTLGLSAMNTNAYFSTGTCFFREMYISGKSFFISKAYPLFPPVQRREGVIFLGGDETIIPGWPMCHMKHKCTIRPGLLRASLVCYSLYSGA